MKKNFQIDALLDQQQILVLDGGLATELEKRGANLDHRLWSARMLMEDPDLIRAVHYDFMAAGADVIISSSYQASISGFVEAGMSEEKAADLIRLSVELACEARKAFCASQEFQNRLRPRVAASIGPYGACLADGSEYRGDYGLTKKQLSEFHRPRMEILSETDAELFAFETIPSQLEAEALLELVKEFPRISAWLSFSCKDKQHVCHGEPFAACVSLANAHPQIVAVGVNCTRPEFVSDLLQSAACSTKPLLAYPNSGEDWNSEEHCWTGAGGHFEPDNWVKAGARLVGGCCRVGLEQITALRASLIRNDE